MQARASVLRRPCGVCAKLRVSTGRDGARSRTAWRRCAPWLEKEQSRIRFCGRQELHNQHRIGDCDMDRQAEDRDFARFDVGEIMRSFPQTSDTLLIDTYLTDQPAASARVFRFYRPTPPHYHVHSDEYLYALSGKGTFWMGSRRTQAHSAPGRCCFSSAGLSTPCRISPKGRLCSSRSTPHGGIRRTSFSSIRRTERRRVSFKREGDEDNAIPCAILRRSRFSAPALRSRQPYARRGKSKKTLGREHTTLC
jgi:mannose-6-phosphate isomerase-like protein (cupin superfamily)